MIVYGRNAVCEALKGRRTVTGVMATKSALNGERWLTELGGRVKLASGQEIEQLAGTEYHQGVAAEVSEFVYSPAKQLLAQPSPLIVALDQVQDPQNLGAICRSAECVGASGVVITERRSAEITAAVCKASAGAVEHLQVARVKNLADFLVEAKEHSCWSYGAAAGSRLRYDQPDYSSEGVILVLGAEGSGLRPRVADNCDQLVGLPMSGKLDSLNVSVTAAVLMFEVARQRGFSL